MRKSKQLDLTKGSVMKQLIAFAMPILFANVLQHLYNVADKVVVGQFAQDGTVALAAVGSTAAALGMILNLILGFTAGTNVICANYRGARKPKALRTCMHSSMMLGVVSGLIVAVLGIVVSRPLLRLMSTPENVLDSATLYMRIYLAGSPVAMIYNFGASIMRAHGDTKRPMYILMVSGLVNVLLNLVLVIFCHMDVAGVAIATVASQVVSAAVIVYLLFSPKGEYKMSFKELRMEKSSVQAVVRVGIPCGLNNIVFSFSNMTVQSALNSFNSAVVIAGKTAATDIVNLTYQIIASFAMACTSFAGQCYGAGDYKRIDKLCKDAILTCWGCLVVVAGLITIFQDPLLWLFNSDPEVIEAGRGILMINSWGYMLYAVCDLVLCCSRGMGKTSVPTILSFAGICVPRILWAMAVFPFFRTVEFLFLCYPISWFINSVLQIIYYVRVRKQVDQKAALRLQKQEAEKLATQ